MLKSSLFNKLRHVLCYNMCMCKNFKNMVMPTLFHVIIIVIISCFMIHPTTLFQFEWVRNEFSTRYLKLLGFI